MNRHLYSYGASLAMHATVFLLVALIATNRHAVPLIEIDFTVCSAHAAAEQKTAASAPAPPVKKPVAPQPEPRTVSPPVPTVQPAPEKSVQAVSEVAVAQTPREPAPPAPQPVAAASAQSKHQTSHATATSSSSASTGGDSKGVAEQARAKYVKEQFSYIRDKIASHVRYPRHARRMGWSGAVQVSFIIEEHGGVSEVRIVRGSQVGMLDDEALDSVKRSAPFPRPPVRARIIIPVEFVLG